MKSTVWNKNVRSWSRIWKGRENERDDFLKI
jgi:hypothetical protein